MKTKTIYVRKGPNNEPTRLQGSNGNSYEIKSVVNQPIRKAITIVNKNNSNNYQGTTSRIVTNQTYQTQPRGQPVYATLNTVRQEGGGGGGGQGNSQSIRTTSGPIRLTVPKSSSTSQPIRLATTRTYSTGNVVSQPIRVQLRSPSNSHHDGQTKTIIQTVVPRGQQVQQRRERSTHYQTIKQNAVVGTADNGRRVIQSRSNQSHQTTTYQQSSQQSTQQQYDDGEYYTTNSNQSQSASNKKRQRETREDEGGPGYVKAKGTWYRARKCHKCDKTFPWASSLRRHLMTHTGLKPYCCAACKAQFTTKSNLERHVLRRHGVLDKEGQAKYIIKLSQAELQRQLEEESGGDPDINSELFGAEQDDRRNKIVTTATVRPATTQVTTKKTATPVRRSVVQSQGQYSSGASNTKYVKYEYQQGGPAQEQKEIIYDIQDGQQMIGTEVDGQIEYHEEPIEYHDGGQIQYEEAPVQETYEYQDQDGNVYKTEYQTVQEYQEYDDHGNPVRQYEQVDYENGQYPEGDEQQVGEVYDQAQYEQYDEPRQEVQTEQVDYQEEYQDQLQIDESQDQQGAEPQQQPQQQQHYEETQRYETHEEYAQPDQQTDVKSDPTEDPQQSQPDQQQQQPADQ